MASCIENNSTINANYGGGGRENKNVSGNRILFRSRERQKDRSYNTGISIVNKYTNWYKPTSRHNSSIPEEHRYNMRCTTYNTYTAVGLERIYTVITDIHRLPVITSFLVLYFPSDIYAQQRAITIVRILLHVHVGFDGCEIPEQHDERFTHSDYASSENYIMCVVVPTH